MREQAGFLAAIATFPIGVLSLQRGHLAPWSLLGSTPYLLQDHYSVMINLQSRCIRVYLEIINQNVQLVLSDFGCR